MQDRFEMLGISSKSREHLICYRRFSQLKRGGDDGLEKMR